ncbi:MAG: PDZ domain-containing protein [Planctomycetota bacterium]|nr:PDZ domain-containing protein [Planctomycetota bacterium]
MFSRSHPRTGRPARAVVLGSFLALAMASCQTAPDRSIPDPLPEALGWALPPANGTAFLGLEVRENDSGSLESLSFDPGVRVHEVTERSPAAGAGVRVDDVVLAMDGVELAVPEDLTALLSRASGGDRTTLQISRGDTVFDVELTLGGKDVADAPSGSEAFVLDPARSRGAWGTADGAVLVARAEDGPVGLLDVGARVVALDGDPIVSGRGLVQRLVARAPGERVTLGVAAGDVIRDVQVTLLDEGRRTTRISIPILATYDAAPDRSREEFVAIDLYFISLFRYARDGGEKRWSFLRFFQFASGVGELDG